MTKPLLNYTTEVPVSRTVGVVQGTRPARGCPCSVFVEERLEYDDFSALRLPSRTA